MTDKLGQLPPELPMENFIRLRNLMLEKTGMFFDENKYNVVRNVIAERIAATKSPDFDSYFRFINEAGNLLKPNEEANREFRRLIEGLVVNETTFFRNKEHFAALQHRILPLLLKRNANKRHLRLWSAGCSTGQEPYSLAIQVIETLERHGERLATRENDPGGWKVEIIATDISEKVLLMAQNGRYRREDMRGILNDKKRLERFFRPISSPEVTTAPLNPAHVFSPGQFSMQFNSRAAFEVAPEIRNLVRFGYFNLADPVYPPEKINNFDLVLCENVMIYFSPEVTRRVIENIYKALCDGGFLFIGFSETLWQVSERFRLINTHETFYYQKPFPNDPPPNRGTRTEPTTGPLSENRLPKTDSLKPPTSSPPEPPKESNRPWVTTTHPKPPTRKIILPYSAPPGKDGNPPANKDAHKENGEVLPPPDTSQLNGNSSSGEIPASTWEVALDRGLRAMEAHEFDNAAKALEEALVAAPHEVDVLCAVAELKVKLSDYDAAINFCLEAIKINVLCEQAHLLLAMIYHNTDRIAEAVKEYKQTIYINGDSVIANMQLGDILSKQGKNSEALRHYKNALQALEKYRPDHAIEGIPVEILKQTVRNKIRRLQGPGRLR